MGAKRKNKKKCMNGDQLKEEIQFNEKQEEIREEPKEEIQLNEKQEEIKEEPKEEIQLNEKQEDIQKAEDEKEIFIMNTKEELKVLIETKTEIEDPKEEDKKEKKINDEEVEEEEDEEEHKEEKVQKKIINKRCSLKEHREIDAIFYCQECKINMCNKCEKVHSGLLQNHHIYSLDKDINEIFTGLCTKPNHSLDLQFYCKTHNELCCAACISKIRLKGNGQHKNCQIYYITKIKKNKMENLGKNIKDLEELSNKLEPSIKELKSIYEQINESKEKLKMEIQKLFTKIRTELNKREDELYLEIDKKYDELFFKADLIKESEKLPNIVKISLEKGNIKENDWNDENKLSKIINDCIKIENTIKNLNLIYDKINIFNSNKELEIEFNPKNDEIDKGLLNEIKEFGKIKVKNHNSSNKELVIQIKPENDEIDIGLLNAIKEFENINVKNSDTKLEGKKPTREKEKKENEDNDFLEDDDDDKF